MNGQEIAGNIKDGMKDNFIYEDEDPPTQWELYSTDLDAMPREWWDRANSDFNVFVWLRKFYKKSDDKLHQISVSSSPLLSKFK